MNLWKAIFGPGKMPEHGRFRILKLDNGVYQVQELQYDSDKHDYVYVRAWERDENGTISVPMEYNTLEEAEHGVQKLKDMYIRNESKGTIVGYY